MGLPADYGMVQTNKANQSILDEAKRNEEIAKNAKDMPFYEKEKVKFNNFNKRFAVFNRKME